MKNEEGYFDREAPLWDENPGRVRMANSIADVLLKSIPVSHSMRVLDFGCGTGLVTLRIQPLVNTVTGMDSSKGMLGVLAEKVSILNLPNVVLKHIDIEQAEPLTGQYDLIVCSMTLHHVKNPASLLQDFCDVMTPGGYIGLADLEPDNGLFHGENRGVHHNGFARETLSNWLTGAGFVNISFADVTSIPRFVPGGITEFKIFLACAQKV